MRALKAASDERGLIVQLFIALSVMIVVTLVVATVLHWTEGSVNNSVFDSYWNCVFWTLMAYLANPAGVGKWELVTSGGRVVAVLAQIVSIAFFAAFTGLLVTFISTKYKTIHHRIKLKKIHKELLSAFQRQFSRNLKMSQGHAFYIVPSHKTTASLKLSVSVDLDDVVDVASRYYGFRVKNLANIRSIEDQGVTDRFIVEHFPVNRRFGCCLDRKSNVTIVSPSSDRHVGIGWFSYYIAHFGAFNYISKDYDPEPLNRTSFYNIHEISDAARPFYNDFLRDVEHFSTRENSWIIFMLPHTKSKSNEADIHISFSRINDMNPTAEDPQIVCNLGAQLAETWNSLKIQIPSSRYPLAKHNIVYQEKSKLGKVNSFTVRVSYSILKSDTERLLIAHSLAEIITGHLHATSPREIQDMLKDDISKKKTDTYSEDDWL